MPYSGTPWVRKGKLVTESGRHIRVDSAEWFDWLQSATRFCYSPDRTVARFTARKEKRRHRYYWFGYLKKDRKLHNIYLGKTETLTQSYLDQACERLLQKTRQATSHTISHE